MIFQFLGDIGTHDGMKMIYMRIVLTKKSPNLRYCMFALLFMILKYKHIIKTYNLEGMMRNTVMLKNLQLNYVT